MIHWGKHGFQRLWKGRNIGLLLPNDRLKIGPNIITHYLNIGSKSALLHINIDRSMLIWSSITSCLKENNTAKKRRNNKTPVFFVYTYIYHHIFFICLYRFGYISHVHAYAYALDRSYVHSVLVPSTVTGMSSKVFAFLEGMLGLMLGLNLFLKLILENLAWFQPLFLHQKIAKKNREKKRSIACGVPT